MCSSDLMPMTSAQLQIIARLSRNEGIGQAALAALLEMEPMTVSRHVDRMVAAGLVERVRDPNDRRARQLFTTEKSRSLIPPMRERAQAIFDEAQAGLAEEERDALIETLTLLVKNLSRSQAQANKIEDQHDAERSGTTRAGAGAVS